MGRIILPYPGGEKTVYKNEKRRLIFSSHQLLLGNWKQEDGRQNNNGAYPKTGGHFIHVAEKEERHNDAIHWLEVGDKRHTEGR